jgi:ribosome biogenesis GTPase / thiamine phosphate phosphatase
MNSHAKLKRLGYNKFFDDSRIKLGATLEQVARVTAEHKGIYEVVGATGDYHATVTGNRMQNATSRDDFPAVGDWVITKDATDNTKIIVKILPRKTALHKKYGGKNASQLIATNIDIALIVESVDRDYNLNRFERYLVLARESGIKPVIILNKSDLSSEENIAKDINEIRERFGEVDVLATSTLDESGIQKLTEHIKPGKTYCFLGSSGVGKSSIINKLLQHERIATGLIGEKTGRGRHTTTSRQMYFTNNGGIIIDNPGSREVGVADSVAGVDEVFADIESIAVTCKFKNCKHTSEPGCAIQNALNSGAINPSRYENFQKLVKETEHYELSPHDKRQKDKKFGKYIKNTKTDLKKFRPR